MACERVLESHASNQRSVSLQRFQRRRRARFGSRQLLALSERNDKPGFPATSVFSLCVHKKARRRRIMQARNTCPALASGQTKTERSRPHLGLLKTGGKPRGRSQRRTDRSNRKRAETHASMCGRETSKLAANGLARSSSFHSMVEISDTSRASQLCSTHATNAPLV